ncbi:hypothetical protein LTR29_006325 [Friedmanniomyces endolithicus]|nr:hypothetical protein LTR29_006325 [Friedmanniomyces endolithicus]
MPSKVYYTKVEDDIILKGRREKRPTKAIAGELGRTCVSVRDRSSRLDLKGALPIVRKPHFSTEDWDKVAAMRAAGETFRAIAHALQVSLGTVLSQRQLMSTKPETKPDRTVTSAGILEMISLRNDQKLKLTQIAIRTGKSIRAVEYALRSPLNPERKPLKTPPRAYTQAEDEEIIRLREQDGLTYAQIATQMQERSTNGVQGRYYRYLQDRGPIRTKDKSWRYTKDEAEQLIRLRKEGHLSFAQIAELFPGRNALSLSSKLSKLMKGRK